jgi:hypothetical protein
VTARAVYWVERVEAFNMSTATPVAPKTVSVEQCAAELGIGRTLAYLQAQRGHIAGVPVLRVGRRLLVSRLALDRVLAGEAPLGGRSLEGSDDDRPTIATIGDMEHCQ